MNAFADWLFSTMFSWMGNAANSAWNAIVNAKGSLSSFFSNSWLIFVVIIILFGTILDYAVWFARWRPYLVWRSWFKSKLNKRNQTHDLNELEQTDLDDMTRDQLANWVNTPQESYPVYDLNNPSTYDTYYPKNDNCFPPAQREQFGILSKIPENDTYVHLYGDISANPTYWPQPHSAPFESYQQQVPDQLSQIQWDTNSNQSADYPFSSSPPAPSISFTTDTPAPLFDHSDNALTENEFGKKEYSQSSYHSNRQRRSERKNKAYGTFNLLGQIKERLTMSDDQDSMLDGLPSPIRQEDAFHEAVYPQSYNYQESPRTRDKQQTIDHEN